MSDPDDERVVLYAPLRATRQDRIQEVVPASREGRVTTCAPTQREHAKAASSSRSELARTFRVIG